MLSIFPVPLENLLNVPGFITKHSLSTKSSLVFAEIFLLYEIKLNGLLVLLVYRLLLLLVELVDALRLRKIRFLDAFLGVLVIHGLSDVVVGDYGLAKGDVLIRILGFDQGVSDRVLDLIFQMTLTNRHLN